MITLGGCLIATGFAALGCRSGMAFWQSGGVWMIIAGAIALVLGAAP